MKALLPLFLGLVLLAPVQAQVLSTNAVVADKTIGEWTAEWWKWIFAIPTNQNPGFDTDGSRSSVGQSGPVFFLAGALTFSHTATRSFTVPADKYLFFPVLNVQADNIGTFPLISVPELRDLARGYIDATTDLHTIIDGVAVTNLFEHRAVSPVFSFDFLTTDNINSVAPLFFWIG